MKIYDVLEYLLENQSSGGGSNPEEIPTQLLDIKDEGGSTTVFQLEVPSESMTWREFLTNPTYVDIMKNANLLYILEDQYFSGVVSVILSYSGCPRTNIFFPSSAIRRKIPASSDSARILNLSQARISSLDISVYLECGA